MARLLKLGDVRLIADSLDTRLQIAWTAWTAFEVWSQQSINFLRGGGNGQIVALPVLIAGWFAKSPQGCFLLLSRFGKTIGSRQLLTTGGTLFLIAWLLLDMRWSANNLRQIKLSIESQWSADDEQRAIIDLDGEIYQYIKRLKSEILDDQPARILIIGDEKRHRLLLAQGQVSFVAHTASMFQVGLQQAWRLNHWTLSFSLVKQTASPGCADGIMIGRKNLETS